MTYLVINLASCLFFAQLLGLLLGWLLWGYVSGQRKKEIVLLRQRLNDASQHMLKPPDDAVAPGVLSAARDFKKQERLPEGMASAMADLPPLQPLPPEEEETEEASEIQKDRDALVLEIQVLRAHLKASSKEQGSAGKLQEEHGTLKTRLVAMEAEHEARAAEWERKSQSLRAELNNAVSEKERVTDQVKALQSDLGSRAEQTSDLEQQLKAIKSEVSLATGEREKSTAELISAKVDFEKRSAWLTKRIHELERMAEESERAKQDLKLAARAESGKPKAEGAGDALAANELAALTKKLEAASAERDKLTAEVAGLKRQVNERPEPAALAEALKKSETASAERDKLAAEIAGLKKQLNARPEPAALTEALKKLETASAERDRLAAQVTGLKKQVNERPEPAALTEALKKLETASAERDKLTAEIAGLKKQVNERPEPAALAEALKKLETASAERDKLTAEVTELKNQLSERPEPKELTSALRSKEAQLAEQVSQVERLLWRVAELESSVKTVPPMEASIKQKDAQIAVLTAEGAERDAHIRTLLRRMTDLEPLGEVVAELKVRVAAGEEEAGRHVQTRQTLAETQKRLDELQQSVQRKDAQIAVHSENEKKAAATMNGHALELQKVAARAAALEAAVRERQASIAQLQASHAERDATISKLHSQVNDLKPLPDKLHELEEKHQAEVTRLKVSSAQRLRRLRQGISSFKS